MVLVLVVLEVGELMLRLEGSIRALNQGTRPSGKSDSRCI